MGARVPDRGRNRREPGPGGRQRRSAGHRTALRCLADGPQPGRHCLFARARLLGPLLRRCRGPLRPQGHPAGGHGRDDPGGPRRRLRTLDRRPLRGADRRRPRGRDGLSDHPGADHGALVGPGPHEVDRALGGHRRERSPRSAPSCRRPLAALLLGITLPAHAALRGDWLSDGDQIHPRPRQRGHGAGRPSRRRAHDLPGRRLHHRHQLGGGPGQGVTSQSGCSQSPRPPCSPSTSGSAERPTRSTTCMWPPAEPSGWPRSRGSSSSAH